MAVALLFDAAKNRQHVAASSAVSIITEAALL
jgi:hypothetical protein